MLTKIVVSVALLAFCYVSLTSGETIKKKEWVEGCKNETKYNPSRHGPNSNQMKCFRACMMKKEGAMTSAGQVVPEKAFPPDMKERLEKKDPEKFKRVSDVLKTCAMTANKANADNLCERAHNFHSCKSDKAKDAFASQ